MIIALEVAHQAELFQCETCSWGRHCDASAPAPFAKWVLRNVPGEPGGVLQSRTCLLPMISEESYFLLRLHGHYKQRLLPYAGGLLEQPNFYLEAMEILSAREAEILGEKAERQRRELERAAGRVPAGLR